MTTLQQRLQAALPVAMKARDKPAVTALRSALAAIDNAAAVAPGDPVEPQPGAFAQAAIGLGVTEVARREQDEAEIERIVRAEIAERLAAADEYDRLDRPDQAGQKRAEARALAAHV
jgi:uncharacterized protein YqeY